MAALRINKTRGLQLNSQSVSFSQLVSVSHFQSVNYSLSVLVSQFQSVRFSQLETMSSSINLINKQNIAKICRSESVSENCRYRAQLSRVELKINLIDLNLIQHKTKACAQYTTSGPHASCLMCLLGEYVVTELSVCRLLINQQTEYCKNLSESVSQM